MNLPDPLISLVSQALGRPHDDKLVAQAVRETLDSFAAKHPGRGVEVRVPPYRVVQVLGGSTHRRGTPPAVVEMSPLVWLALVSANDSWQTLVETGQIIASGVGSDLSDYFDSENNNEVN